jgi:hypothetical protein
MQIVDHTDIIINGEIIMGLLHVWMDIDVKLSRDEKV